MNKTGKKKTEVLTYNEGKKLLRHITENAAPFKLSLVINKGLPMALLFIVSDQYMLGEKNMNVILESGILLGHLWINISLATATEKRIFNFVLCPLKFLVDQEARTLVMRLKQLAGLAKECQVTISNKQRNKQLVGQFKLDIFNDYADQMTASIKSVTDTLIKSNYSETCFDCIKNVNRIEFTKLSDLVKVMPESSLKELGQANDNFNKTSEHYMKRYKSCRRLPENQSVFVVGQ